MRKTYNMEFFIRCISTRDYREIEEAIYEFIDDFSGNYPIGYVVVCKRLYERFKRQMWVDTGKTLNQLSDFHIIYDTRCRRDAIYVMATDNHSDIYQKVGSMVRYIGKMIKEGGL